MIRLLETAPPLQVTGSEARENAHRALPVVGPVAIRLLMQTNRSGQIAVIFRSVRTCADEAGYAAAAEAMERLAALQTGYAGIVSARNPDGEGVTVSYWEDEAAAKAWRDNPDHARIREEGRRNWYSEYSIDVTQVGRSYDWSRND